MTSAPSRGLSGIELDDRDSAIHPGDDLYRHMNETWDSRNEIPSDKARFGAFTVLAETAEAQVREIAEQAPLDAEGSDDYKVGALYRSFMAEDAIEKAGFGPLRARIAEMEQAADSLDTLLVWMGQAERRGLGGFFQLFIDNDPGQPDRYLVFVEQSGISLPGACGKGV